MISKHLTRCMKICRCWVADKLWRPFCRHAAVYFGRKADIHVALRSSKESVEWKQKALSDFNIWLSELPEELPASGQEDMTTCDLYTMLTEFAALRQEIKFQNRQQHKTIGELQSLRQDLGEGADLFRKRSAALDRLEENVRKISEKRSVSQFLDIRDALIRGLTASRQVGAAAGGIFRRPPKGIGGIIEGYEMALRRFDRALAYFGIRPLETVGCPFDPAVMQAIDRQFKEGVQPDVVLEELSGGFVRDDEVTRAARVIVSRPPNR